MYGRQACRANAYRLRGHASDRLADTLAVLVELEHGELVRGPWLGGDQFVKCALGILTGIELADQVGAGKSEKKVTHAPYESSHHSTTIEVMARGLGKDPEWLTAELRERRSLLERSAETYVALAACLDDEIATLEAAQRLAVAAEDVDFEGLLDRAEQDDGPRLIGR